MLSTGYRIGEILSRKSMGAFPIQAGKQLGVPIGWKAAPYGTADWISVNGITRPKATFGETKMDWGNLRPYHRQPLRQLSTANLWSYPRLFRVWGLLNVLPQVSTGP